jgi:hypothetical protein
MSKSEFHKLREKYPDIFDNPSRLPTLVRQIALFVQQELEQEENGTDGELTTDKREGWGGNV